MILNNDLRQTSIECPLCSEVLIESMDYCWLSIVCDVRTGGDQLRAHLRADGVLGGAAVRAAERDAPALPAVAARRGAPGVLDAVRVGR